jgi:putative copper resistance protein D
MAEASLIAARIAVYATLLPAAGLPLYLVTAFRVATLDPAMRRTIAALATLCMIASAWWALASVAAMAAMEIPDLDRVTVMAVLDATPLGIALEGRTVALLVLAATAAFRVPRPVMAVAALVALGTAAITGHAGASEGGIGTAHRLADMIHLAAAACWIGALLTLAAGAFGRERVEALEQRLASFAFTGSIIVALIVASGIANTLIITGWPLPWASRWTLLLAAKVILFAVMLGLAALNRWRFTPALNDPAMSRNARSHLRASLLVETAVSFGVLALVSVLGVLDPSAVAT